MPILPLRRNVAGAQATATELLMTEPDLPGHVLDRLVRCGHADDPVAALHRLFTDRELQEYSYVTRLRPEPWLLAADALGEADLVALIRTLTLAERDVRDWNAGSVSPIIWLYRVLLGRCDLADADALADWILTRSQNPYLPFGTNNHGARSLQQLAAWHAAESERRAARAHLRVEEMAHQDEARRMRADKATQDIFNAVRRGDSKAVAALIARGADLSALGKDNLTAEEYARHLGRSDIAETLARAHENAPE